MEAYEEIMEEDHENENQESLIDRLDEYLDIFARKKLNDMKITKKELIDAALEKVKQRKLLN